MHSGYAAWQDVLRVAARSGGLRGMASGSRAHVILGDDRSISRRAMAAHLARHHMKDSGQ
jgi:hypothetical protein